MARTRIRSKDILDGGVKREDINTTISGRAVITKLIGGHGLSLSSTGADSGTGDVTVSLLQGTTGTIPQFGGHLGLLDSVIHQDGSNVGIGTTSPATRLMVKHDHSGYTYISVDNEGSPASGVGGGFLISEGGTARMAFRYERDYNGTLNIINGGNGNINFRTGSSFAGATNKVTITVEGNVSFFKNSKLGMNNDLSTQSSSLKLRSGYSGDQTDAGTIAYRPSWNSNSLSIVGAGTSVGNRTVHIWDIIRNDNIGGTPTSDGLDYTTISRAYGDINDGYVLSNPVEWLTILVDDEQRLIPLYLPEG